MKKYLSAALAVVLMSGSVAVSAQVKAYKGNVVNGASSIAYALPRTVVKVTVVTEKETVHTGPYARFAQKYLGVMAPLSDKEIYTLAGATVSYSEEADPSQIYIMDNPDKSPLKLYYSTPEGFVATAPVGFSDNACSSPVYGGGELSAPGVAVSHLMSDSSFVKVPVDKQSVSESSPESMAVAAANMIFNLRKRRIELITGEQGENVFGAGLEAALAEINRLEQEYIALFLGKQYRRRIVKVFDAIPEAGSDNTIAFRFNESSGAIPSDDLTGRPVVLDFTVEGKVAAVPANSVAKDSRGTVFSRIADIADCRLVDGRTELYRTRIPVYQFGKIVQIPVTSMK